MRETVSIGPDVTVVAEPGTHLSWTRDAGGHLRIAQEKADAERREYERLHPPPPPPPVEPTPPAIPFQYIGLLGPKEQKIGVFEEGKDIVIARVGETVRGQFKLVELKHDAAIIGYVRKEFQNRTKELPMKRR